VKINQKVETQREAKVLKIHAKCRDCCSATLLDQQGKVIKEHDGYVPDFMPGQHYGDYIILDIDVDTGQILNWNPPSRVSLECFIEGES
jgi:hypothetical protein